LFSIGVGISEMMVQALFSKMFLGSRRCLGIRTVVAAAVIVGTLVCPVGLWASNDLVLAGRVCNSALTPPSAEGAARPRSSAISDYANLDHLPQSTRVAIADRFQYLVGIAQQLEAVVGEAGRPGGVLDLQIDFADLALRAQLDVLRGQTESVLRPGERLSVQQQERILSHIDASAHVSTLEWMRDVYVRRLNELNSIVDYLRDQCAAEVTIGVVHSPIDSTSGAPVLEHRDRLEDPRVRVQILNNFLPEFIREAELRRALVTASLENLRATLREINATGRLGLDRFAAIALDYPHVMGSLNFNLEGHLGDLQADLATTTFRLGDALSRAETGQGARGPFDPRAIIPENRFLGVFTSRVFRPIGLVASLVFGFGPLGLIDVPARVDNSRYIPSLFTNHDADHLSLLSPYQSAHVDRRVAFLGQFLQFVSAIEHQGQSTQVDLLVLLFFDAVRERGLGPISSATEFKTALFQVASPRGQLLPASLPIVQQILSGRLESRLVEDDFLPSLRGPITTSIRQEVALAVNTFLEWLEAEVAREVNVVR
jgi:hypothetical protein